MDKALIHLLLADDDKDDCLLFKEALDELEVPADLSIANDGEQLMRMLVQEANALPSVVFLDLNMPRKNGFECLTEIRKSDKLKILPVIIFSTSFDKEVANLLYNKGAQYYIRKPSEFSGLKKVIQEGIRLAMQKDPNPVSKEKFII